jgi:tyrosyl-tRNA synthetase
MQLKALWQRCEIHARKYNFEHEWAWKRGLINNSTWWNKVTFTEVLQTLGPGLRMGAMLAKDTVKNKMEKGDGMSFAEFTYPVMQAWDWWHMYQSIGVQLQIGGNDQYGNITAGMDAVKYIKANHSDPDERVGSDDRLMATFGITTPLLTTSSGEKFGKSAGNAIWLDKEMTSVFDLYQVTPLLTS